ncbi:hypothetical protein GPECTOR_12g555 [Gonium pectorale]|uniref:Uncharacterized protein n=1 Tax=Gonium pectorale TaxID=33097 RepID=A0A150GP56_GONPE|nr:hypothetical protein GPECTOR_12g555 [Gonium pectorale]|eukprot:KXZ51591.1 hypothetical protein GPECTOR_12g555 [Gonium pectorale]
MAFISIITSKALASPTMAPQSCTPRAFGSSTVQTVTSFPGDTNQTSPLPPSTCDYWTLPISRIGKEGSCVSQGNGPTFLLFEFWRLDANGAVDTRPLEDVHVLVARGTQPNVLVYDVNDLLYQPPLSVRPYDISSNRSTLRDADAALFWRPYHRIVASYNASSNSSGSSSTEPGSSDWFVTVSNLDRNSSSFTYALRVSCVNETTAPCPRPLPSAGQCSDRGTCVAPPQGVASPALTRVCKCDPGRGDYGCQTAVPLLANGAVVTRAIEPNGWAFWQLRVPLPPDSVKPSLLVELSRSPVGFGPALGGFGPEATGTASTSAGFGGDPVLVVMPKDPNGSNRLPWFSDLNSNNNIADLRSYFLQQNLHYVLTRNLIAGVSTDDGWAAEYYVAVHNNRQRFTGDAQNAALLYPQANVTIRVRWSTGSGPALCPNDCYGGGTCHDPWGANSTSLPASIFPAFPAGVSNPPGPPDFMCGCTAGRGGRLCEGRIANMTLPSGERDAAGALAPGQWSFSVLSLDPAGFSYARDTVAIRWRVIDGSPDPAAKYSNAYLTIDENAFPRDAVLDSNDPFRRGWQIFYSSLAQRSDPPVPLQLRGSDLKPGLRYVLGMYNSDYTRKITFNYSLSVGSVGSIRPSVWLVLASLAALCILIV